MNPQEWKIHKMYEVTTDVFSGGTPATTVSDFWDGDVNWLSSGETGNRFINETIKKITPLGVRQSSTKLACKGDVIVASAGQGYTRGQSAFCNIDTYINQSIISLRANQNLLDPLWLFYTLQNRYEELRIISDSHSSRGSLTTQLLKNLEIIIPPLKYQEKVVEILRSLDDKIELNLQMNKTLEAVAQAMFKEWFVDFRFPGFDGILVDGLPKGWRKSNIGELILIQNGFAFKSSDFKGAGNIGIIKIKNISNNYVNINDVQYIDNDIAMKISSRCSVISYDVLIAMTGAEVGKVGLVPKTNKILRLNQRVGKIDEKIRYAKWFAYIVLSSPEYQNLLFSSAVGSAQPNISATQIESIETVIPTLDIVGTFGELINPLMERICENYFENQLLCQIRDNLLPKLMTGKIRVA